MTIVRELADAIHLLADLVRDTRELASAVDNGHDYFVPSPPEAKIDLTAMLSQTQATVAGLASVTWVVTSFRFTIKGATPTSSRRGSTTVSSRRARKLPRSGATSAN